MPIQDTVTLKDVRFLTSDLKFDDGNRLGNYKLARSIINRMMPSKIKYIDDTYGPNITGREIDLLLNMCRICNSKAIITGLHYKELTRSTDSTANDPTPALDNDIDALMLPQRTYFAALHNLYLKGYITLTNLSGGFYEISIIDNCFDTSDDDRLGYIDVNRDIWTPGTEQFKKWFNLSVNAKKLLLYLLSVYNPATGYYKQPKYFQNMLGVSSITQIVNYVDEINKLLPSAIYISRNKISHRLLFLNISKNNPMMATVSKTSNTIKPRQQTYLKRIIKLYMSIYGVKFSHLVRRGLNLYDAIVSLVKNNLSKVSLQDILRCFYYYIRDIRNNYFGLNDLHSIQMILDTHDI